LASATLVACASISGLNDFELVGDEFASSTGAGQGGGLTTSSSSHGTTSTSSGDGGMDCDGDDVCVIVPAGAQYVRELPDCSMGTEIDLLDCSQCGCENEHPTCVVVGTHHDLDDCTSAPLNFQGDGCINHLNKAAPTYIKATVTTDCGAVSEPVPTSFCQTTVTSCNSGAGLCIPTTEPGCILVAEGDMCPSGYGDAQVRHQSDSCGCACADSCPKEVTLYSNVSCVGAQVSTVPADGGCHEGSATGWSQVNATAGPNGAVLTCEGMSNPMPGTARKLCCPGIP
jgi:hypothetical protein